MTIYLEVFLLQNLIINFCLLRLLYISTRYRTNNTRLFISASVGAFFSVISAYCISNFLTINLLKLACSSLMILLAFKVGKKQFLFSYILLFIYTYAFGGVMMGFASNTYFSSRGIIMQSRYNLELITTFIVILTYIFELSLRHTKQKILNNNYTYKIELKSGKRTIKIKAYIDTGNNLSYNGRSVMVLDNKCFLKLIDIDYFLKLKQTIRISTISGNKTLTLFMLDELKVYSGKNPKVIKNQYIAVDDMNSFLNTDYQALLSPTMI